MSEHMLFEVVREPAEDPDRVFMLPVLQLQEIVTVDGVENR